jgi:AhpD family alkylhydroperoxidase
VSGVARRALRGTLNQVRYVRPVRPGQATGLVRTVYGQLEADFGLLAPPIALHSPAPAALAASWALLRETLVAQGAAGRAAKEAVAAAVSVANQCPYCAEVHGVALLGLDHGPAAEAVAARRPDDITDPSVRAAAQWAANSGNRTTAARSGPPGTPRPAADQPGPGRSGAPGQPRTTADQPGPGRSGEPGEPRVAADPPGAGPAGERGDPRVAAELLGVATTFQYLNRMVSVFLPPSPLPPALPGPARRTAQRVLAGIVRGPATAAARPGTATGLLRPGVLPADLGWAADAPPVAAAFGAVAAAVREELAPVVPETVQELVRDWLAGWDGTPPALSRAWAEPELAGLAAGLRPLGRLALLTAAAPYQVDAELVGACGLTGDELVRLTSWSAFTAARTIAAWTPAPVRP